MARMFVKLQMDQGTLDTNRIYPTNGCNTVTLMCSVRNINVRDCFIKEYFRRLVESAYHRAGYESQSEITDDVSQ